MNEIEAIPDDNRNRSQGEAEDECENSIAVVVGDRSRHRLVPRRSSPSPSSSSSIDRHMIALYYCYPPGGIPIDILEKHVEYHTRACRRTIRNRDGDGGGGAIGGNDDDDGGGGNECGACDDDMNDNDNDNDAKTTTRSLNGRIRVSSEGINGVLSEWECDLASYVSSLRRELARLCGDGGGGGGESTTGGGWNARST